MAAVVGTAHFGFTVEDMEKTLDFWINAMGAEQIQPLDVAVHPGYRVMGNGIQEDIRFLATKIRVGGSVIELFQFLDPVSKPYHNDMSMSGSAHIALLVDDIYAMVEELTGKGVIFQSGVNADVEDEREVRKWIYLMDPNRIRLELIQELG